MSSKPAVANGEEVDNLRYELSQFLSEGRYIIRMCYTSSGFVASESSAFFMQWRHERDTLTMTFKEVVHVSSTC